MERVEQPPTLGERRRDAHKGDFGRVCIIAGSLGMSGAAALAGRSALRAGAGLVRVAVPGSVLPIVASIEPCFTTVALPEDNQGRIAGKAINVILDLVEQNDVIAFGPGVGTGAELRAIVEKLIGLSSLRMVVDADGLNNLAGLPDWPGRCKASLIVTPHPGEMRRLWSGLMSDEMPSERIELAAGFARQTGTVTLLKGAGTVVTDGQKVYVNGTGNPGMATAGSGDVLTGMIAALAAQGLGDFEAAALGAHVHGLAGDIAAESTGYTSLIATDIVDSLGKAFARS